MFAHAFSTFALVAVSAWVAYSSVFGPLAFVPVPWPDASAFVLPGLDLWRTGHYAMHAQAPFVPGYAHYNFNTMPALPSLLGGLAWLGGARFGRALVTLASLFPWIATAWLVARSGERRARWLILLPLAVLLDPVLRWGSQVVRPEGWVVWCWALILREWQLSRGKPRAFVVAGLLALAAYVHFEAVFLVPGALLLLGDRWSKRIRNGLSVSAWTVLFLSPWLLYVAAHLSDFGQQMAIQFGRLAHGNSRFADPYAVFHNLFVSLGVPGGWPKVFNLGKTAFWGLFAVIAIDLIVQQRGRKRGRSAVTGTTAPERAAWVTVGSFYFLWFTKQEDWFVTLVHGSFWIAVGYTFARWRWTERLPVAILVAAWCLSSAAAQAQLSRRLSQEGYARNNYERWTECVEQVSARRWGGQPGSAWSVFQPHVPDALIPIALHRHSWRLVRALDFPAEIARARAWLRDEANVVILSRTTPGISVGGPRLGTAADSRDFELAVEGGLIPFARETLSLATSSQARRAPTEICEVGPFWALVVTVQRGGS